MSDDLHDPGGKGKFKMLPGVRGDAAFSPDGKYRYWLKRDWTKPFDKPGLCVLWIGMNPSTATADVDDLTIRREMKFTREFGFTTYVKVNVMDYRATDPKWLSAVGVNPCSDLNLPTIVENAQEAGKIILAYGSLPSKFRHYADAVLTELNGLELHCMGLTADGQPRHPSRLSAKAECIRWRTL